MPNAPLLSLGLLLQQCFLRRLRHRGPPLCFQDGFRRFLLTRARGLHGVLRGGTLRACCFQLLPCFRARVLCLLQRRCLLLLQTI